MTTAAVVAIAVVALAVAAIAVAVLRVRRRRVTPATTAADWTDAAGQDFTGLSDSARCDMIFAIAALDGGRGRDVLERALADPSEAVALAAAHALTSRGAAGIVDRYFGAHPSERNARIVATVALLAPELPATASS